MPNRSLADWLERIQRQHPKSIELGLERVRAVAARMNLKRPGKRVITVAGTNGKGSTVAFVEAIARAAGRRVGAYTSPHLVRYNERIRIDGVEADDAALVAGFEQVEAARGDTPLTYFEYGTLAALWLFAQARLDLAVLEVGLGGRLDAVNLVDPDVAVITSVDLDHQDWLGPDRESIGREKAGILRPGKPLVLAETDPPSSVLVEAYTKGAFAIRAGCDYLIERHAEHWVWREPGCRLELPYPRLDAPAQLSNASAAIAALRAAGGRIPRAAFAGGVAAAQVAGRLQRFERDGVEIVVDIAHNPQAARQLAEWLALRPASGRTFAVFGALADKDAAGLAAPLAGHVDAWWLAGLANAGERGQSGETLAGRIAAVLPAGRLNVSATVEAALAAARGQARSGDRVLVFGSFHTAGAALAALQA